MTVAALVAVIDRERAEANLSSAIRVFVLAAVKAEAGGVLLAQA